MATGATVEGVVAVVAADAEQVAATPAGLQLIADAEAAAVAALSSAFASAVATGTKAGATLATSMESALADAEVKAKAAALEVVHFFQSHFEGKTAALSTPPSA